MTETQAQIAAENAPPKSGIVWLASYPKSGNTWTRSFIHNLMKVIAGEEGEQDINELTRFSGWDISKQLYTDVLGFEPGEEHRQDIANSRQLVQQRIADAFEGIIFAKTHQALVVDRGIPTINFGVTSGAIYIIRNPLDVAISFAHHLSQPLDVVIQVMGHSGYETAVGPKSVYEVYGSWSEHVLSWTRKPHHAILTIRYEDMLEAPQQTFGALARHLLIDATPEQIAEATERSSFKKLRAQEDRTGFREKPEDAKSFFREGRAGQWKEVLTRAQVDRIVNDHSAQMARFGYLP